MGVHSSILHNHTLIESMTSEELANYMSSLNESYEKYASVIIAYGIDGSYVMSMNEKLDDFFKDVGVTSKKHQKEISRFLLQYYTKRLEYYSKRVGIFVLGDVLYEQIEDEEDIDSGCSIIFDAKEQELKQKVVIQDVVTTDPRTLMTNIFKIQGIPLDPTTIDPAVARISKVIGHCETCDGEEKYDCFINYRVASEANTALTLYLELKTKGINAYLDKKCLKDGEDWKQGFLRGLRNSRQFVALISTDGLSKVRDFAVDHTYDNVLIEYQAALKIKATINKDNFFVPVFVGKYANNTLTKFGDFSSSLYPPTIGPTEKTTPL